MVQVDQDSQDCLRVLQYITNECLDALHSKVALRGKTLIHKIYSGHQGYLSSSGMSTLVSI